MTAGWSPKASRTRPRPIRSHMPSSASPIWPAWRCRPASASTPETCEKTMRTIDVGIIGGGLIAQVEHLPNILNLPGLFRFRGIPDPSATLRRHLEARFGVKTFATAEALLAQPLEAWVIASPDSDHADLSRAALLRGLH